MRCQQVIEEIMATPDKAIPAAFLPAHPASL